MDRVAAMVEELPKRMMPSRHVRSVLAQPTEPIPHNHFYNGGPGEDMDIGRFLGIALLVLLLTGCQWLSSEDEVRLQTAATEPTPATTPIPIARTTPHGGTGPNGSPHPQNDTEGDSDARATHAHGEAHATPASRLDGYASNADSGASIPGQFLEQRQRPRSWGHSGTWHGYPRAERGRVGPLHIVAAVNPDPAVMRLLLDQGADIMTLDARGQMPLHWAAGFNSLEMVSLLVDSGSEVHGLDDRDLTPLHVAGANNPDPRVAALLLDNGAQLHAKAKHGRNAVVDGGDLQQAGGGRGVATGPRSGHRWGGRVGFHDPASGGLLGASDVVRLLLERGSDPNSSHDEGSGPPLLPAAMSGDPLVVKALLEYGADVHLRDESWGWTPLHVAVSAMTAGYAKGTAIEVAQLLLDQGADIHAQDNEGRTPLHLAVTYDGDDDGLHELVAMLGSERPPIEATDMVGFLLDGVRMLRL